MGVVERFEKGWCGRGRRPAGAAALLAAGLALGGAARAQPSALAQLELEELLKVEIVSAARKAQPLGDVAAAVHVITREDLLRTGARNLPEALRLAPGMDAAALSGSYHAVTARGFPGRYANKLQVLIDGRSVYWEMVSGVMWEAEVPPLDDIDRIEVLRGPAGAIWGPNAVNGVVNIITRPAHETLGTRAQARAATGGESALALQHGWHAGTPGQDDGPDLRLHAQHQDGGEHRTPAGAGANDQTRLDAAGLRADWRLPQQAHLTLQGELLRSRSGTVWHVPLATPPYLVAQPGAQVYERAQWGGTYERALSPAADVAVRGSVAAAQADSGGLGRYRGRDADLDARWRWHAASAHDLILGLGARWSDGRYDTPAQSLLLQFDPARRARAAWGLYAQDEIALAERWRLTLGTRVDRHSDGATQPQPNLRLLWKASEHASVWGAASRAVRVPSRVEEDGSAGFGVLPPGSAQNPGALPVVLVSRSTPGAGRLSETVQALELGARVQLRPTLSLDVAAFANRYRDALLDGAPQAPRLVPAAAPYLESVLAQPHGVLRSHGLELAADWLAAPGWRHQLGWSFLRFDAASRAQALAATAAPEHQLLLRSSIDLPADATLDLLLRHAGARRYQTMPALRIGARTVLDLHLRRRVTPALELSLSGYGLLRGRDVALQPDFGQSEPTRLGHGLGLGLRAWF